MYKGKYLYLLSSNRNTANLVRYEHGYSKNGYTMYLHTVKLLELDGTV